MRAAAASLWLEPMDRVRVRLLRAAMPVSSYFVARRAERIAALGAVSMLLSLLGTAAAPLWMLALGPVLLGVPHLLADLRYCVVRPGWHRRPAIWVGVGLPLLAVALTGQAAIGFAAVAGACAAAEGPRWRRALGILAAALAAALCLWTGPLASLALVHLHNFVAVLLWWRWRAGERPGARRLRTLPLAMFGFGSLLILGGAFDPGLGALARVGPLGADLERHLMSLAPGIEGTLGLRLVLLFCFAQSVHYLIWLRMVPEDDRDRPTPRSFTASWRALIDELGPLVPRLAVVAALALALWAVLDLAAARHGYLRAAEFHVFLELAVLASMGVGGRGFVTSLRSPNTPQESNRPRCARPASA